VQYRSVGEGKYFGYSIGLPVSPRWHPERIDDDEF
jgi:hypothetical protein